MSGNRKKKVSKKVGLTVWLLFELFTLSNFSANVSGDRKSFFWETSLCNLNVGIEYGFSRDNEMNR